jgi:hypothetical protein
MKIETETSEVPERIVSQVYERADLYSTLIKSMITRVYAQVIMPIISALGWNLYNGGLLGGISVVLTAAVASVDIESGATVAIGVGSQTQLSEFEGGEDNTPNKTEENKEDEEDVRKTLTYKRSSSKDQVRGEKDSIENQKELIDTVLERHELEKVCEFKDIGETGRNYNRSGWRRVGKKLSESDIEYLTVAWIDRIGRGFVEGIHRCTGLYLSENIKFVSSTYGVYDLNNFPDFIQFAMDLWSAEDSNKKRTDRSNKSKGRRFSEEKRWRSLKGEDTPPAIELINPDDRGSWVEKGDETEADMIEDMYEYYIEADESRPNKETVERLEQKYDEDIVPKPSRVPDLIRKSIYIGVVTPDSDAIYEVYDERLEVLDRRLAAVEVEKYKVANEKRKRMKEKFGCSRGDEEVMDLGDAAQKYSLAALLWALPSAAELELKVDGEVVIQNGNQDLAKEIDSMEKTPEYLYGEDGESIKPITRGVLERMEVFQDIVEKISNEEISVDQARDKVKKLDQFRDKPV